MKQNICVFESTHDRLFLRFRQDAWCQKPCIKDSIYVKKNLGYLASPSGLWYLLTLFLFSIN